MLVFKCSITLETKFSFNIIFIQKSSWTAIHFIPSSRCSKGEELVGNPNYPDWLTFSRNLTSYNDFPRVVTYINIRLSLLWFLLCKDFFNHRNILLISFFNNSNTFYMMNIYSDSSQSALKYLKNTKANIRNFLIMSGNFNIRNNLWDPLYPHYLSHNNDLFIITDFFNLELSTLTNQVPTRYSNNCQDVNLVLDLIFLYFRSNELNNHIIYPE